MAVYFHRTTQKKEILLKTRQSGMLFALVGALLLFGFATSSVGAANLVEAGKIKLIGLVKSVNPQKHTFILSTAGYADENSQKWTVFGDARPKTVIVPSKTCYIYAKGIIQGQVSSGRLRVGMPVIVAASAVGAGVGKPVTAESVGLFVNGTALDLAAYNHQLSGEEQAEASGPVTSPIFDLNKTLGKAFPTYEASLGKPTSKEKIVNEMQNHGEHRMYKSSALLARGITEISLGTDTINGAPNAVTSINVRFKQGTSVTWQDALGLVAISPAGVSAVEVDGTLGGDFVGGKLVGGTPFHSLKLGGISIPSVTMAKSNSYHLTVGYEVTWYDKDPRRGVPELDISYNEFAH